MTVMDSGIALCEAWILINKWKSGKKLRFLFFWGGWKSQDQLHEEKLGLWIYGVVSSVRGWAEGTFLEPNRGLEGDTLAGRMFGTVVWFSGKHINNIFSMTYSMISYP